MIRAIPLGKYGRRPGRDVVCPRCKAGIGLPCRLTWGKHVGARAQYTHPTRLKLSARRRGPPCERCGALAGTPCDPAQHDAHVDRAAG